MALIECKECKANISDEAKTCPQCGAAVPQPTSRLGLLIGGIFIFFLARFLIGQADPPSPPQKSDAQTAADAKKEADFQKVVRVAEWAKKNMKNPASFELTYGGLTDKGAVCIEYRGTNSFNAVVPGRYVMSDSVSGDTAALWNKHCVKVPIRDFTDAKYALN